MKLIRLILTSSFLLAALTGCSNSQDKDIVILATTDVHCGVSDYIGYAPLCAYKDKLVNENNYVSIVDSGDFLQGSFIGLANKGEYIIEIMNALGYEFAALGNHEFDYGMDTLKSRIEEFNGEMLSCNITYNGKYENKLSAVKAYAIKKYGKYKIGYVGITTPWSTSSSNPDSFKEEGEYVYHFSNSTPVDFYNTVQASIDSCRHDGADYIFLLSHLGYGDNYAPYRSIDLVNHTSGYDAVFDGHAHMNISWTTVKDKNNKDIPLCDAGYKMNEVAQLTIKKDGSIVTDFIVELPKDASSIDNLINRINDEIDAKSSEVVTNIDIDLPITDSEGIRMTRSREMPYANLVADTYKYICDADIGIINGGAMRYALSAGNITFGNLMSAFPFNNMVAIKRVKGETLLNALEMGAMKTQNEYKRDGKALGEFGGFIQVSDNIRYTIDTSIASSVTVDDNGAFISVGDSRRVTSAEIYINNNYVPISKDNYYTVASVDYLLTSGGDGLTMFKDSEDIEAPYLYDYEAFTKYIDDYCHNVLIDKYSSTSNRITII